MLPRARFGLSALALTLVTAALLTAQQGRGAELVAVQLLAVNDFHGALEPPAGNNGRIDGTDAGGVEYLSAHLARLRAANPNTVVVAAGDNIGGSPLLSSLSHDEAAVEALNLAGLQLTAVGNHDLDEGWWELLRVQRGGCHPVDGCQDGTPFAGAAFTYLAANIVLDPRRATREALERGGIRGTEPRRPFPPYVVRRVGGVPVGFIGIGLQETPSVIIADSIRGLTFTSEIDAANEAAHELRQKGVRAIVVLIHEGGTGRGGINGCGLAGEMAAMAERTSPDIDVIVSGHSHQAYNCTLSGKLVTSASSSGRLVTDIDLQIRRSDGEVVASSARNVVVSRDVPADARQTALIAHYRPVAEKVGGRVVGRITASLTRAPSEAGETALGDVVADAMHDAASRVPGGADFAFQNPGGIRADVVARPGVAPAPVTYAELFEVLPFGNTVIVKTLTGEAIVEMLEQQFGAERTRIMQVSKAFTYRYDPARPRGQRVDRASIRINGSPLVPTQRYRVATNDFLWGSGDDLSILSRGTDPVTVGLDVDVLVEYFQRHSPVSPGPRDRIGRAR